MATHILVLETFECEKWHMLESLRKGLWLSEEGESLLTDSAVTEPAVPVVNVGSGFCGLWVESDCGRLDTEWEGLAVGRPCPPRQVGKSPDRC